MKNTNSKSIKDLNISDDAFLQNSSLKTSKVVRNAKSKQRMEMKLNAKMLLER